MSKNTTYVQCTLARLTSTGWSETTSYLPQSFARLGGVLRLKDDRGRWTSGWIVQFVSDVMVDADRVPDYRKAIREHRKATGDSEPRMRA